MKVLNLEDDAIKHSEINRVLHSCGIHDIVWKRNLEDGLIALEQFEKKGTPFELIVTDMNFPETYGGPENPKAGEKALAAAASCRSRVPVILCSSVRYQIPAFTDCVWYSDRGEWQEQLRKCILKII